MWSEQLPGTDGRTESLGRRHRAQDVAIFWRSVPNSYLKKHFNFCLPGFLPAKRLMSLSECSRIYFYKGDHSLPYSASTCAKAEVRAHSKVSGLSSFFCQRPKQYKTKNKQKKTNKQKNHSLLWAGKDSGQVLEIKKLNCNKGT